MDFKLLIAISILIPSFIGSAAAQSMAEQQDFTQDEIIEMANKAVVIVTQSGTFTIEIFPEAAPNHVYHFLKLKYDLEESHFTAAPTSILNYPINNIEKNEKVTILSGENIINETKIFKKKVIIEPGTTFNLKKIKV